MQFLFDGQFYKAIKVTGPSHNMLGLVLNEIENDGLELIELKSSHEVSNNISALDVKNQVLSGIDVINRKFGVNYNVEKIQYVSSDTPSESVYEELTIEIINRIITGGGFTRI